MYTSVLANRTRQMALNTSQKRERRQKHDPLLLSCLSRWARLVEPVGDVFSSTLCLGGQRRNFIIYLYCGDCWYYSASSWNSLQKKLILATFGCLLWILLLSCLLIPVRKFRHNIIPVKLTIPTSFKLLKIKPQIMYCLYLNPGVNVTILQGLLNLEKCLKDLETRIYSIIPADCSLHCFLLLKNMILHLTRTNLIK